LPNQDFIMRLMVNSRAQTRAGLLQLFTLAKARSLNEFLQRNPDVQAKVFDGILQSLGSTRNMQQSVEAAIALFEKAGEERFLQMAQDGRNMFYYQISATADILSQGQDFEIVQDAQGWHPAAIQ